MPHTPRFAFGLMLALLVLAVACGGGKGSSGSSAGGASATSTPSPSDSVPPAIMASFYPEFSRAGLKIKNNLDVRPPSKIPTTVVNTTDAVIQADAVRQLYTVFEALAVQGLALDPIEGEGASIDVMPRTASARYLLLIPQDAMKPRSTTSDFIKQRNPTADTAFDNKGTVFTYVELRPGQFTDNYFASVQQFATFNLAVEACQEVLHAVVVDKDDQPLNDTTGDTDAQEVVCNSLGAAVASKMLGLPYQTYQAFASSHPIRVTSGDSPGVLIPEDGYDSFPQTGTVIQ